MWGYGLVERPLPRLATKGVSNETGFSEGPRPQSEGVSPWVSVGLPFGGVTKREGGSDLGTSGASLNTRGFVSFDAFCVWRGF